MTEGYTHGDGDKEREGERNGTGEKKREKERERRIEFNRDCSERLSEPNSHIFSPPKRQIVSMCHGSNA